MVVSTGAEARKELRGMVQDWVGLLGVQRIAKAIRYHTVPGIELPIQNLACRPET